MAQEDEPQKGAACVSSSSVDERDGSHRGMLQRREQASAAASGTTIAASMGQVGVAGGNTETLMKRTLVVQSKKIQQLTARIDEMEAEGSHMRQQVGALQMAVFEASTRAEQTAEQYKREAVEAAVLEIAEDREVFAEGHREAVKRIGELEDALEIALKAAGGVHKQLLELGLSCEDLGKTSVHLSVQAQEALEEDKPALAVAGSTIETVVGVMRAMERSGVFDLLDPVDDEEQQGRDCGEGEHVAEQCRAPTVVTDVIGAAGSGAPLARVSVDAGMGGGSDADRVQHRVARVVKGDEGCSAAAVIAGDDFLCEGTNIVSVDVTADQSFPSAAAPPNPIDTGVSPGSTIGSTTREKQSHEQDIKGSSLGLEQPVSLSASEGRGRHTTLSATGIDTRRSRIGELDVRKGQHELKERSLEPAATFEANGGIGVGGEPSKGIIAKHEGREALELQEKGEPTDDEVEDDCGDPQRKDFRGDGGSCLAKATVTKQEAGRSGEAPGAGRTTVGCEISER